MSYGMARLKADWFIRYRNRRRWPVDSMEQDLVARLAQGRERRHLVEPGGAWWRHTEIWKAERDGNAELVEKLEAEGERQFASTMTASRSRLDPGGRK